MSEFLHSTAASVISEHSDQGELSVAHFEWPEHTTRETYLIAPNPFVSFEVDSHIPVRPKTVSVYDEALEESMGLLGDYIGPEVAELLASTKKLGSAAVIITLNPANRLAIATLQLMSPSTPQALRRACQAMVHEHWRHQPTNIPDGHPTSSQKHVSSETAA